MKKVRKTMKLNDKQRQFVEACISKFGKTTLTIDQLKEVAGDFNMKYPPQWLVKNHDFKVGKGLWKLPTDDDITNVSDVSFDTFVISSSEGSFQTPFPTLNS